MKNIVLIALLFIACSKTEKKRAVTPNDLPAMQIHLANGESVDAKTLEGKTIIILFFPDCDHCQHEAKAIEENISAFRDHMLYFVSSASMAEIKNFANDYKLSGLPNVMFGWASSENVVGNFGFVSTPSIYIYSAQGKLVKYFNGQVEVGEVLKYL